MNGTKGKKSVGVAFAAVITALLLIVSCVAACIAVNAGSSGGTDTASAALEEAQKEVTKFADDSVRNEADFSDNLFKKGTSAAMMYQGKNNDGQLEKISAAVGADSIVVTDAKGKITESYPDDKLKGKTLKENKMGEFGKISKGIVDKMMSDPNKTDDGYKVNVGIRRQDGDGLVVIGFTDDSYENVTGENLAASISKNVIIEKDGKILSTNFEPAKDSESIEAFEKKAKDAGYTFDGKRYETKKGEADVYTVMVAVSEAANSNTTAIVIIVIANAALILIGVCLYLVSAKKK